MQCRSHGQYHAESRKTALYKETCSLFLTNTIIVLFGTVAVYFRTKHSSVRALLIAGITGMVRQILIVTIPATYAMQVFASGALYAVLIAGVVLVVPTPGHISFFQPNHAQSNYRSASYEGFYGLPH